MTARSTIRDAANRNPRRPETWIQIGYCKVKQGCNDEAIRAYKRALQLRPTSADAYNKLGDAYYYAARFNEAIEAYGEGRAFAAGPARGVLQPGSCLP